MSDSEKTFLESGLLTEYMLGRTNEVQTQEVEQWLDQSAEVRAEYERMQEDLEQYATEFAQTAPDDILAKAMLQIDVPDKIKAAPPAEAHVRKIFSPLTWAASILFLIAAGLAGYLFTQNQSLQSEILIAQETANKANEALKQMTYEHQVIQQQFRILNDPGVERVVLNGNTKAPNFQTIAYWNAEKEQAHLQLVNLQPLPQNRVYQMWADIDGEMVSLGVLPAPNAQEANTLIAWKYLPDAESLNVTIEEAGGSDHPTVSRLVSSVVL